MKLGLKLCSVLMVLPLVMGVQKHRSDSLYTDLTIGGGSGVPMVTLFIPGFIHRAQAQGVKAVVTEILTPTMNIGRR